MIDDYVYPTDVAAEVAVEISRGKEISMNDALVLFMQSDTFQRFASEPGMVDLGPSGILSIYNEETGEHIQYAGPTEYDCTVMKASIVIAFAEDYDVPHGEAATLFKEKGIFEYLDEGANRFIFKLPWCMADVVAERLEIPVR